MYDGASVRQYREAIGLSQARLAEISGLPQHLLSAFELGKERLSDQLLSQLRESVAHRADFEDIVLRKKRYRKHRYSFRAHDPARSQRHHITDGNAEYLRAIADLARAQTPVFSGLSLFAGCGGMSLGFQSSGCAIKGFVEIDDGLSSIYVANFPNAPRLGSNIHDVSEHTIRDFVSQHGPIDVLLGGPPCQGFSLAGKRRSDDPRNELFRDYMRFVDIVRPKVALIENVRLLTSMKSSEGIFIKDIIIREFRERGYLVDMAELNANRYGVPQHRERVIFVAVDASLGKRPSLPPPSHGLLSNLCEENMRLRSFGDACSDLSYLESGEHDDADPLHQAVKHPDHVIEWLWDVPEGRSAHDNTEPKMRPPSGYNTTYKRQIWYEPAGTVQTTFGMISGCRNVHPIATRALTVREAARVQSFPDTYQFPGSLGTVRTGIGNALPPLFARAISAHVRSEILDLIEIPSL